jgi:hypothetical protein
VPIMETQVTLPQRNPTDRMENREPRFALPDRSGLAAGKFGRNIRRRVAVDATTYQQLLISNRFLERCDRPDDNQLGLYDPRQETWYWIGQRELFREAL